MQGRSDRGGTHGKQHAALQKACVAWANASFADLYLHAPGNAALVTAKAQHIPVAAAGAQRKKLGAARGIHDLLLFNPSVDGRFVGCAIELKIDHSSHPDQLKPAQLDWAKALQTFGWRSEVVHDFERFTAILTEHLGEPSQAPPAATPRRAASAGKRPATALLSSPCSLPPAPSPLPPLSEASLTEAEIKESFAELDVRWQDEQECVLIGTEQTDPDALQHLLVRMHMKKATLCGVPGVTYHYQRSKYGTRRMYYSPEYTAAADDELVSDGLGEGSNSDDDYGAGWPTTSQSSGGSGSSSKDNGGDEVATSRADRVAVRCEAKKRRREATAGIGVSVADYVDLT